MEIGEDGVAWNFDINNGKDGWKFNKYIANVKTENGVASMDIIGKKAEMALCGDVNYSADEIKEIAFGLNASAGKLARVYFVTDSDGVWSEDKSFAAEISPGNRRYKINTADNAAWKGKIIGLKLVPTDAAGKVSIDYIKLVTK